ncbi:MAG: hypothetical protein JW798_17905, partial [Prolixibacteraceae bacterium]|nr:hypothetical protein [Prolixibacteraceae bacterium]
MEIRKLLTVALIAFLWMACQSKAPNDYTYYQPYQRDTLKALKQIPKETVTDSSAVSQHIIQKSNSPVNLNHKYFIVIASYTIEEFGLETLEEVKKNGFSPELFMLNNDGWYKLAVESYQDIHKADSAL